jgi:hypothetical protein
MASRKPKGIKACRRPALVIDYAFTDAGTTFIWGFRCNDPVPRVIDCYIIVADA